MWRIIIWFLVAAGLAWGLTWVASHPGTITVEWMGWRIEEMPVALALGVLLVSLLLLWLAFRLLRWIIGMPFAAADVWHRRQRRKTQEAITTGMTALLAGNAEAASRAAAKAGRLAPANPLARLLQAQAALSKGELRSAQAHFNTLKEDPATEPAALHGLYEIAMRQNDVAAAQAIAERAQRRYPDLPWASQALLRFAALAGDWPKVRRLLEQMRRAGLIDKQTQYRQQAATLAAEALALEDSTPDKALELALKAHRLDPSLVPAALVAGRLLAARGKLRKAAKVLEKTWKLSPHPDIAEVYAHLRSGDAPRDRLARVQQLLKRASGGEEGAVALARAAIDAQDWEVALGALRPWLNENPSARIFLLMAELEEARSGDIGRMREWLRRARHARPDPAWVAQGFVSPVWLPLTPDGEIGTLRWGEPPQGNAAPLAHEPVPEELLEAPLATTADAAAEARDETTPGDAARTVEAEVRPADASAEKVAETAPVQDGAAAEGNEGNKEKASARSGDGNERPATTSRVKQGTGTTGTQKTSQLNAGEDTLGTARVKGAASAQQADTSANAKVQDDAGKPAVQQAATIAPRSTPRGAEAVAELPEEEMMRPPLPDDPGPPRNTSGK